MYRLCYSHGMCLICTWTSMELHSWKIAMWTDYVFPYKTRKTQRWKQCSLSKGVLLNIELLDFNLPFMLNGAENAVRHYNVKDVQCAKLSLYSSSISRKSISSNFFPNKPKTEWTVLSPNNTVVPERIAVFQQTKWLSKIFNNGSTLYFNLFWITFEWFNDSFINEWYDF